MWCCFQSLACAEYAALSQVYVQTLMPTWPNCLADRKKATPALYIASAVFQLVSGRGSLRTIVVTGTPSASRVL